MFTMLPSYQKTTLKTVKSVKYYQKDLLHINYNQSHYFWQSYYKSKLQRDNFKPSVLKLERASESPEGLDKLQIAGSNPPEFLIHYGWSRASRFPGDADSAS